MSPAGPEQELHDQVTGLAEILGWEWMHVRPMFDVKRKVYRTGTTGTLAKGWLDLFMVRSRDRRLIFAELKGTKSAKLSPDQERVMSVLRPLEVFEHNFHEIAHATALHVTRIEVYAWWPEDWPEIERVLR